MLELANKTDKTAMATDNKILERKLNDELLTKNAEIATLREQLQAAAAAAGAHVYVKRDL